MGFRWSQGQKLTAVDLDAEFDNVIALYNNLSNVVGTIQATGATAGPVGITVNWAGQSVVTNGTYIIELQCPYTLTVTSMNYGVGSNGGSFIATVRNAGVAISGLGPQTINAAGIATNVATANNIVQQGTQLDILVSGVSGSPSGSVIQINGTRASQTVNAIPVASATTLGGVIVGSGLTVSGGGVLSAPAAGYVLPAATTSVLGGVVVGTNLAITGNILTSPFATATSFGSMQVGRGLDVTSGTGIVGVTYGTTANTACQGNDSRISGAISAVSPALTGVPTAPTATVGTNTTQLATTAFVLGQGFLTTIPTATSTVLGLVKPDGVTITNNLGTTSVTYGTTPNTAVQGNDSRVAGAAPLFSPQFTGTPLLTTTPAVNSNGLQIASTQYVDRAVTNSVTGVSSVIALTGAITLPQLTTAGVAPLASPTFTGVPLAPTATAGTNTTQLATTQFVTSAVALSTTGVSQVIGNTGAVTLAQLVTGGVAPLANPTFTGTVTIPTGALITGYATLASPTLTGVPAAPTATAGTATSQIATTQFVSSAVAASTAGVSSLIGLTGAITLPQLVANGVAQLSTNTFTGAQIFNTTTSMVGVATFTAIPVLPAGIVNYAPIASPTFTGTPLLTTTPAALDNSLKIASTLYVDRAVTTSTTGVSSVIGTTGAVTLAQLVTGGVAQATGTNTFTGAQTFNTTTSMVGVATFTAVPVFPAGVTLSNATLSGTPTVAGYLTTATAATTYATLANPTFTGTINMTGGVPTAPTATLGTNTTQVATTAFVQAALLNDVVATIGAGTGPGYFRADSAGNMTVDLSYPFPPITVGSPVLGGLWPWLAPRAVTITSIFISCPQLIGAGNAFSLVFQFGPTPTLITFNPAAANSITVNGTTGGAFYTPTSPISLTAGMQIYFAVAGITGTPAAASTIFVQYQGVQA